MLTQKPGALSTKAQVSVPKLSMPGLSLSGNEAEYTPVDLALTVTGLPAAGMVLKADRLTRVVIGDTLSAGRTRHFDSCGDIWRGTALERRRSFTFSNTAAGCRFRCLPISLPV